MTPTTHKTWRQWTPAAIAAGAIGAAAVITPLTASAAVDLTDKTPAQVLELVQNESVDAFSGTVEQTSNLGLPDLAAIGPTDNDDGGETSPANAALELLTGSHTANVFVNSPDQARLQVLDQLEERNIIRNGDDLWYYNSDENEAVHATAKNHKQHDGDTHAPDDIAARFLEKIDPSTEVTVGSDRSVAGRAVYDLILTPRSNETLVGSVSVAVDGETGLPLGVTVVAKTTNETAFSSSFTEVSYEEPDANLFTFTPPEGATVTEVDKGNKPDTGEKPEGAEEPTVVGKGWDAVVVMPAGEQELPEAMNQLSTPVDGGRLIETTLVNVLITDDGRVLAGSVTPERLQAVAAGQ
ncbi:outer membrane lipoprotein carrier protein LolA [Arthrobacter tecti]